MKLNFRLLKEARYAQTAIIISICLGLIGGIMGVLQARQVSLVIDQAFLEHKTIESVSVLLAVILLIIVLRVGFVWVAQVSASEGARRIKQDLRHRLYTHILNIGPAYLKSDAGETQTGELVATATEGIDALEIYFSQYLPQVALAALIPISILAFVFPTDVLSGVIFLATAPLLPLFMYLIGSAAETLTRKQWLGLSRMSAYFLDVLQGLTTLKSLGRSRDQIDVIGHVSERYRLSTMSVLKVTFLSALTLELIATLSTAVVAVEIGLRLLYGRLAFEQAFFILLLAPEFYLPLRLLGTRFHAGMAGVEAAKRIFEILDIPVVIHPSAASAEPPESENDTAPSISLRDVSFSYAHNRAALEGVSFEIPSGKLTAIVGESGSGKTTLTWLLLRFLQPHHGQILVNGQPITEIPNSQWLQKLAYVSQSPYLFNDTILANIKLARPAADNTSVYEAARLAHADEFIQTLPMGYETPIGERGVKLSAGQAQRIALARAFLKNASFLILDEATSHLDPETDTLIRSSLKRLSIGRTVLVIAHHQNTLTMADQVVTLSHGRVMRLVEVEQAIGSAPAPTITSFPSPEVSIYPEITPLIAGHEEDKDKHSQKTPIEIRLIKTLSPFMGRIFLSIFLGFATIASGIGLMAAASYIISVAALHPSIAELQIAIVGVRFFGLSRGIFRYLERLVSHDVTFRLLARWRVWFYQALEPLSPARLLGYHSGDLLTRLISDIGSLENFYVRSVAPPLVALMVVVSTTLLLGGFAWQVAWGLLAFLLLAALGLPLLALFLSHSLGPKIVDERAHLSTLWVDGIQGMADLMTCGQASAYRERMRQSGEHLSQLQNRMSVLTALQTAIESLLANLGMLAVLALAIPLVSQGQLDGVLLAVVTITALTCFEAMQPLPQAALNFEANRAAARRLFDLVDAVPAVVDSSEPLLLPQDITLEVQGLSFQYPSGMEEGSIYAPAPFNLTDVSFSLQQGKHIALIGQSGAGKTTLVNLLLRFWEYQSGIIYLGGHELRHYSQADIQKCIAVISQNTYLFSTTIKQNLLIARPHATDDEVMHAARQAQLHDFIVSLPDGYDTWIGEHGLRLSAGERQRLAVTRALLKDAPLLILDEPTTNLDPITELAVLNSIQNLSRGRSTITITQSMVGLESMDEILVLQNGRIIERGTHDQLISLHGLYSRMWDLYHQTL